MSEEDTQITEDDRGYVHIYIGDGGLEWDTNLDVPDLVLFCGGVINRVYDEMFKKTD